MCLDFLPFLSTLSDSLPIYSIVGCTLLFSDLNKKCTLFLFASASGFCQLFFVLRTFYVRPFISLYFLCIGCFSFGFNADVSCWFGFRLNSDLLIGLTWFRSFFSFGFHASTCS